MLIERKRNMHAREVSRAKRLGREIFPDKQDGQFIDPASSHCPRAKPWLRQNPKNKSQQPSAEKRNSSKSSQTSNTNSSIQPNRCNTTGPASFPTAAISSSSNPATQSAQHVSYNHPPYLSSGCFYTSSLPCASSSIPLYGAPQQNDIALGSSGAINSQYGGFVQSPLFNSGGYSTSLPSDSQSISPYVLPQLGVALNQSVPETRQVPTSTYLTAAPQHLSTTSDLSTYQPFNSSVASPTLATSHSGMSSHKYEVVVLKQCVKNCYGCGTPFADKYSSSPFNLVVRHVDRRVPGKNDYTLLNYSRDFSNTYYYLSRNRSQRQKSSFQCVMSKKIHV